MAQTEKRAIHAGHRERLRERLRTVGLEGFSEHEVLELLLTYAIPQRDVNPLAHELINTFGSFSAVLNAHESELMRVSGVGSRAAAMLSMIPQLMRYIQMNAQGARPVIHNLHGAKAYFAPLYMGAAQELVYMVCLDQAGHVLHRSLLHTGTVDRVSLHPRKVVETALRHHAYAVVLAHNHPGGMAEPSQADLDVTRRIAAALRLIDINLVDHLIFADLAVYSMNRAIQVEAQTEAFSYVQRAGESCADELKEAQYRWTALAPALMEEQE